jgi:hypothetical protein
MKTIIHDDKNYVNISMWRRRRDYCYQAGDLGIILMITMVITKVDTNEKGIL